MDRALCCIAICLFSTGLWAQELFLVQPDTLNNFFKQRKAIISVGGEVYQQSNAITNSFVNKFINGGFIDEQLKDDQQLAEERNVFGAGFNFGIEAMIAPDSLFGSDKYGWMLGVSHHDELSAQFTDDLFNLVFRGNKMYAGLAADLSNSAIRYQRFQQFSIGFFEKSSLSFVQLGLVNGNQLINAGLNNTQLFTETSGQFIDLAASGQVQLSDTARTNGLVMNGIGATVNFELNIPFHFKNYPKQPAFLRLGGRNLGLINWSNETLQVNLDSTYNYQGFLIDDLASLDGVGAQVETLVDSLTPGSETGNYLLTTPGWIYASWFSPISYNLYYEVELRSRIYSFHLPEIGGRLLYKPNNNMLLGVSARYGGYSNYDSLNELRAGIFVRTFIGDQLMLSLQTENLIGWFDQNARARNGFVQLSFLL